MIQEKAKLREIENVPVLFETSVPLEFSAEGADEMEDADILQENADESNNKVPSLGFASVIFVFVLVFIVSRRS